MTSTTTTPYLKPPLPSSAPPSPSSQPLLLTIRFSASIADLELDIPHPSTTTVISLKHLIRSRLQEPDSQRRLRFIHGGKILPDAAVLSAVLRTVPPPPLPPSPASPRYGADSSSSSHAEEGGDAKGKGKSVPGRPSQVQRTYVNCSIGDSLTSSELRSEAKAASLPPSSPSLQIPQPPSTSTSSPGISVPGTPLPTSTTTTTAAPRGFDRLLATGFTAAEVNQLRLQFRSIHSSRYTPDTLPSPDAFRRMEDAWIDDNGAATNLSSAAASGSNGAALGMDGGIGSGGTDSDEVGIVAMVDVLIRGVITGFVWPLGSTGWLVREEGMASERWRFMVGVGVLFSVLIGAIRAVSGEK